MRTQQPTNPPQLLVSSNRNFLLEGDFKEAKSASASVSASAGGSAGRSISLSEKKSEKILKTFKQKAETSFAGALFYLGAQDREHPLSPSLRFWQKFARKFIESLRLTADIELLRERADIPLKDEEVHELLMEVPSHAGSEYITKSYLKSVWNQLSTYFKEEIKKAKNASVEVFLHGFNENLYSSGRIYFHLVEDPLSVRTPFAFMSTFKDGTGVKHCPLGQVIQEVKGNDKKLFDILSQIYRATKWSLLLKKMLERGELLHPLSWTEKEAFAFLKEVPHFENAGILCRIPNWWRKKNAFPRAVVSFGEKKISQLGLDTLMDFNMSFHIQGMNLSVKEMKSFLKQGREGFVRIKGKWMAMDTEKIKEVLLAWKKARAQLKEGRSFSESMRLLLSQEVGQGIGQASGASENEDGQEAGDSQPTFEVHLGKWLEKQLEALKNPKVTRASKPSTQFQARLRPYQSEGLSWLHTLDELHFSGCLADDMGLGKTIQVLAFLDVLKRKQVKGPHLLVLPASLIANWISEIKKFSPHLKYYVAHPQFENRQNRQKSKGKGKGNRNGKGNGKGLEQQKVPGEMRGKELVLTTYTMVQKLPWIQKKSWNYVILDEAQAIKNFNAGQTKAVKKLSSKKRLALTGTPIENRLGDLWSLFDFLNPGLLGSQKEFKKTIKKLESGKISFENFKKVIQPYILRRLKTDKSVISDLPEKVELKAYTRLSKQQVSLYKKTVKQLAFFLEESTGIQRKGLVLATLMKLKQICNHGDQFLGGGSFLEKDSGKFQRLRELCETLLEKRERALIFTQFQEITAPLAQFLKETFQQKALVLDGKTPIKKRKEIIHAFQSDSEGYIPFLVLSVKAGGVGLNLTAANHVIHFDRWWNPAVENQATDRAFRIGQKKQVMVHKFVTQGTVEDKIDELLEEKKELSEKVLSQSGEKWITEMSNREVINMFKLNMSHL